MKEDIEFLRKEIFPKNYVCWCSNSPTNYARIKRINRKTVTLISCHSPYLGKKHQQGIPGQEFKLPITLVAKLYS